ncbi:methylated-DNA--[protein]-cysteine S-methyltransferase [Orrella sp. JC864]|uniref:methylated-DNA--[protein]-cysteine S-methyltransferase n=1 Tax=Orrella sp. JC864 TaxID=3120298 RepID=UPI0012BD2F3A
MSDAKTSILSLRLGLFASPLGPILTLHDSAGCLRALEFHEYEARMHRLLDRHYGAWRIEGREDGGPLAPRLQAYFEGDMRAFDDVRIATAGTPFQRQVWAALRRIPPGRTRAYGDLAHELGCRNGSRAVGLANGANPIALVVPCHRVIGADGRLTGFAAGLHRKAWLLRHEAAALGQGTLELPLA